MDDEEYVAHVRAKMWEKSHAYVVEERRRREERREVEKKRNEERKKWQVGVEEALRRGEDRREKAKWKACWERYLQSWEEATRAEESKRFRDRMLWPTRSGRLENVEKEEVERFFRNAPQPIIAEAEANTWAILKAERVRWHPDKVQQKFGSHGIDDAAMRTVTAIFQIVDRMWSEARST